MTKTPDLSTPAGRLAEMASIECDLADLVSVPAPDLDEGAWLLLTPAQRLMDQVRDLVAALPLWDRYDTVNAYLDAEADHPTSGPDPVYAAMVQGWLSPC